MKERVALVRVPVVCVVNMEATVILCMCILVTLGELSCSTQGGVYPRHAGLGRALAVRRHMRQGHAGQV